MYKRQVHIYNNLYEGQTGSCMSLRANCYVFSEYNTFLDCTDPVRLEKSEDSTEPVGACKSFEDKFTNCEGANQAVKVTDKTQTVDSTCRYKNFDTDAKLSYIPGGDYLLRTDAAQAEATVRAEAGVQDRAMTVRGYEKVEEHGTLGTTEWVYTSEGEVKLLGGVPEGAVIFVAGYNDADRCVGIGQMVDGTAKLGTGIGQGKLFWLDEKLVPQYPGSGWGEAE